MTISRRALLRAAGVAGLATALPIRTARAQTAPDTHVIELTTTVVALGTYTYLPFDVPSGVNRVEVAMEKGADAALGLGLFDQRGAGYQSPGFRGIYGEERSAFFISADAASPSFTPGPIEPGTWTVVVPVFRAPQPTPITVTVTLRFGPQADAFVLPPPLGVVRAGPGWYRGDLHCHTPESSDAFASGTSLTPSGWAAECRRIGLDYAAMTDHNVVSQNFSLASAAGEDVLLMPGEEMTNWFHGHATVTGIPADAWLDWRQRPAGVPLQANEARIGDFLAVTRELGAYVSAAHPLFANLAWQFFGDAEVDAAAQTDAIEVWTGQFRPDCEAALRYWDSLLVRGRRIVANGGSDLHGVENDTGFAAGTPTTVVYAEALSTRAITDALRAGRCFVTRLPDGVEIYLRAVGPGEQDQAVGGTVYGAPADVVEIEATVRRAAGMRLVLWANGAPLSVTQLAGDDEVVTATLPIGPGGYVRAEVRSAPVFEPEQPLGSRLDMECFTNAIYLEAGPEPDGNAPFVAPPPQAGGGTGDPDPGGDPDAHDGGTGDGADGGGSPPASPPAGDPVPARTLPATGAGPAAGLLLAGAGAATAALARRPDAQPDPFGGRRDDDGAVAMTMTEVVHRAGTGQELAGVPVRLVGQVTAVDGDRATLTRWTPSCCDEVAVDVVVRDLGAVPVGSWWTVVARWVPGTGAAFGAPPVLRVDRAEERTEAPPRREA